jgi:hypothetical protein
MPNYINQAFAIFLLLQASLKQFLLDFFRQRFEKLKINANYLAQYGWNQKPSYA